ncbi:hypothetical protein LTR13_010025 [Exophiala sideris]|nr:hypothetical protein LTR13_010025 [Exophiala sideris]KAK5177373.1 hypothetical protein LTR44_010168 [Eurotiomycetes sp. CCFEE 6388]
MGDMTLKTSLANLAGVRPSGEYWEILVSQNQSLKQEAKASSKMVRIRRAQVVGNIPKIRLVGNTQTPMTRAAGSILCLDNIPILMIQQQVNMNRIQTTQPPDSTLKILTTQLQVSMASLVKARPLEDMILLVRVVKTHMASKELKIRLAQEVKIPMGQVKARVAQGSSASNPFATGHAGVGPVQPPTGSATGQPQPGNATGSNAHDPNDPHAYDPNDPYGGYGEEEDPNAYGGEGEEGEEGQYGEEDPEGQYGQYGEEDEGQYSQGEGEPQSYAHPAQTATAAAGNYY